MEEIQIYYEKTFRDCFPQIKDRNSIIFCGKTILDVVDGSVCTTDKNGIRFKIPVANICCLMVEPGTTITHEAIKLISMSGCIILWVGDGGCRIYSAGKVYTKKNDNIIKQVKHFSDEKLRLKVVRQMYKQMFGFEPPVNRSIEQLRGIEGNLVRKNYKILSKKYGVEWDKRNYDCNCPEQNNLINNCLNVANTCLYGIIECAILIAGYSPAIGFIHSGHSNSFVFDVADIFKFTCATVPAFSVASQDNNEKYSEMVRKLCISKFKKENLLQKAIPIMHSLFEE